MTKKELDKIIILINLVCHEQADKWKDEDNWKQPYAGNRLKNVGWEIEKRLREKLTPLKK